MAFDVEGAKAAGYSDSEIADHLAATAKLDAAAARKAGYSDQELIQQLTAPAAPQSTPAQAAESPLPNAPPPKPAGPPVQSLDQALAGPYGPDIPPGVQAPNIGAVSPAVADAGNRVVQAGIEGANAIPSTQPVRDWVNRTVGVVPGALINPLLYGAGGVLAAGAGAYRGAQQLGVEILNPLLGPQAARDIVSIPDAFAGAPGMMSVPKRPPIPEAPPPQPRFIGEYPDGGVALPGTTALDRLTGAIRRVDDTAEPRPGRGAPEPEAGAPVPPGGSGPTFLDSSWLRQAGDNGDGTYNMGKGGAALSDAAQQALDSGATVQLVADGGARVVDITHVKNGMLYDDKGQPWGSASVASDGTGREGLRITGGGTRQGRGTEPAGAQITPATELGLTPQEESAYRSTAEGNRLLERQEPGVRDDKVYIEGERINEAERSQDVEVARELNSLREQTPALDKKMTADENHNNNLRTRAIETTLPGQVQITAKRAERERAIEAAKPEVFRGATDADVLPIAGEMQNILNEPENLQNTQLQQYVRPLIARLVNPDGTPKIVNPVELLSWRQDVQHMTSKAAISQDKNLSRVSGILGRVLDVTDDQIELAARGYKARIRDEYRTRSREIEAMEALDAERTKLFESQNVPSYNALQAMLKRIYNARIGDDPYEPFTHVPQATLDKLYEIRDSMRRSRAVDRLGNPRNSRTSQNLGDALRMGVKMALPAAGATLGHMAVPIPFAGEAAGLVVGQGVNYLLSQRGLRQRYQRGMELTEPPRNALGPQL